MADKSEEVAILDMADELIAVANRLLEEDGRDLTHISTALRYAAARFSAHEVACRSRDIQADREQAEQWYCQQFRHMLLKNLDEQAGRQD